MKDNPVKLTAAMKARVRRMRAQYRRRAIAAAIVCFILGCVAGAFAYRWYVNSNPDKNVDAAPVVTATPAPEETALSAEQMDRVLTEADRAFHFDRIPEATVEAGRPDTITPDKLKVLSGYGISRISVNPVATSMFFMFQS